MIKPLDIQNFDEDKLKRIADEKREEGIDEEEKSVKPKVASQLSLFLGFLVLLFVLGTVAYNFVLNAKFVKSLPFISPKHAFSNQKNVKLEKYDGLLKPSTFPKMDMKGVNGLLSQAQKYTPKIGGQIAKFGQQAGAAVLGITVNFMQKTATQEAPIVASAAAEMVFKTTAPALVDQIHRLPSDKQSQIKQLLCK